MPEYKEDKTPVIFLELVDMKDSGFIKDGTENTPNEEQLKAPAIRWIPNRGYRAKKVEETINGKKVITKYNEEIRFIRNQPELSVKRQKELGIEPLNNGKGDKIMIPKGYATIAREGTDISLYDYLKDVFYNESNPDRSERADKIFRIIEKDKQAEATIEDEMMLADAMAYVGTLYQRKGKDQYLYNENKISGLCEVFQVFGETNAVKITSLITVAKLRPEWFMNKVSKWEQTTNTEVAHALQLNVIRFEKNAAVYVEKDKVIKSLGVDNIKQEEKIERLSDWLRTSDGNEAYTELRAEIEAAKEKSLSK